MVRPVVAAVAATLVMAPLGTVWATPVQIATLFNSGVDANRVPLANNAYNDTHWYISRAPSTSSKSVVVYRNDGIHTAFPIGPWTGNDNLSAWIAPRNFPLHNMAPDSNPTGSYYYTTTFNLAGYDLSSVRIYGAWSADDIGAEVILNGVSMRILTSLTPGPQNYNQQTTFNFYYPNGHGQTSVAYNEPLQSGFLPGKNILSFRVDNYGGTTGFRIEMNGTAEPLPLAFFAASDAIPEPISLAVLGVGLIGLIAGRRWTGSGFLAPVSMAPSA